MSERRPVKIAIMALGGQGGGVLAGWIVQAGERAGYIAQSTSVPGVAQRTGATVYYVELFPHSLVKDEGKEPVLALMPSPGDVDIVIAAEMMEAGRAVMRGFVTRETTLIASTHRVYAIGEKIAMSDGRRNDQEIRAAAEDAAGRCIWFDMEAGAQSVGAVISAVMFGALAGSGAIQIPRSVFEETIRASKRSIERNLAGFALGYDAARDSAITLAPKHAQKVGFSEDNPSPAIERLLERLRALPLNAQEIAKIGLAKVIDFQDPDYGHLYLDRLRPFCELDCKDADRRDGRLTKSVAKYLALSMAYDDVIRVADLKTRPRRFKRFREDVRAEDGQIVHVWEYMRPRVEELCDLLPSSLAKAILGSPSARRIFAFLLGEGRRVPTTKLRGFLLLYALAGLRPLRRMTYRYAVEQARITRWLALIEKTAPQNYALACEIAGLHRLIKGYGETHARGLRNFETILDDLERIKTTSRPDETIVALRDAALADEEGKKLRTLLDDLPASIKAA